MNLEPITQNEVRQKKINIKYSHTYVESRKMALMNLFARQYGETDIENRLMDTGRGEERMRCMERVTWKLTLPCVKQTANGNMLCVSGNSNRGSVSA